jgi:hypothetical protein
MPTCDIALLSEVRPSGRFRLTLWLASLIGRSQLMLAYPVSRTRAGWEPILALLLVTTQAVNTTGFLFEKANAHEKPKQGHDL